MNDSEIRIACLRIAADVSNGPDVLRIAREFYAFAKVD
jgi:hypothetical protein